MTSAHEIGAANAMYGPESLIGTRIAVIGTTSSGKSTLAAQLATMLRVPFVELDALFWQPEWTESPDEEFLPKVADATSGDGWVVAGNYHRTWPLYWPRVETVIWLDLPLALSVRRIVTRSWRRSRSQELLWGTNTETFAKHLKLWSPKDSLIAWAIRHHRGNTRRNLATMQDPRWSHIRFIRLRSPRDVDEFVRIVGGAVDA
jgi:adenylate kinase family enzyme